MPANNQPCKICHGTGRVLTLLKVGDRDRGEEFIVPEKVARVWLSKDDCRKSRYYFRFRFEDGEETISEYFDTKTAAFNWAKRSGIGIVDAEQAGQNSEDV